MNRYYGNVGFAVISEKKIDGEGTGIWEETIQEYPYFGDIVKNSRSINTSNQVNPELDISNSFSIVCDPYAFNNFHSMRYIEFMGTKWKITNVDVQYPRLILSVGGVYNDAQQA